MHISKEGIEYIVGEGFEWFWEQFANGSWEPNTFRVFDRFLNDRKNYVDIGAWIGPTVLYAAPRAKQVFAFEPDPVAFLALTQNLKLNKAENVVVYPLAVSNAWKNIELGSRGTFGDSMSSEIWGSQKGTVPAIALESIVLELEPGFIKIDIEGGEKFIFEGRNILSVLNIVQPTIHLSLHTPWFVDDIEGVEGYKNPIIKGLSKYPYFYTDTGKQIELEEAFNPNEFTTVVASYLKI